MNNPTRSMPFTALCVALLLSSACTGPDRKGNALDLTGGERQEDCKRRTRAAMRTSEDMRRVEQPGKFRGWRNEPNDGNTVTDPCYRDPGPGGLGVASGEVKEGPTRSFAKTQARVLLKSKKPVEARNALIPAFHLPAPLDPEVRPLAEEIHTAYRAERVAGFTKSGRIGKRGDGTPTCAFAKFPIVDSGASSMNQVKYLFEADAEVHALCRIPEQIEGAGTIRLTVWRKTAPGKRKLIKTIEAGDLDAARKTGYVRKALELKLGDPNSPATTKKDALSRAYFIVTLSIDRPNQNTTIPAVHDGFFWFAWPKTAKTTPTPAP